MAQWIRSLSFKLRKRILWFKSQLAPINIFSQVFLSIYLYTVYYKATTFLQDTFTYFNFFSIRDSLRVQCLFLQIIKTARNLLKVTWIPSLQMHDLLEILEHAYSLLDGFFQYTHNFMFFNNMCNIVVFN